MLRRFPFAALALSIFACSSGATTPQHDAGTGGAPDAGLPDASADAGPAGWAPGVVKPSVGAAAPRGFVDLRGLIHAHSVYSHDACDNAPRDPQTDAINAPCLDDFRAGICHVGHDFVMLSDHDESFGRSEYPDVLLYMADRGDALITRGGLPVANRAACPDGRKVLLLGGTESATMAVGLEHHVPGTVAERQATYNEVSAAAIDQFHAAGGVSLLQHTEDWTVEQITTLPVDGFEMYNVHRNLMKNGAGLVIQLLNQLNGNPEAVPQSDLIFLPLFQEDPVYQATWAAVLATGAKKVTTVGSDCHRNSLQTLMPDGERIDSYRRMMQWFSNHLLVKAPAGGAVDDLALKEALKAGRLYGAFEVMGYPLGFDYHAEEGAETREMGDTVSVAKGAKLVVKRPHVDDLDPTMEAPKLVCRILQAGAAGWTVVSEGEGDLAFTPTAPGAYRAEVRITPKHLRGYLASYADQADREFPWVYGNAIYVAE